MLIVCGSIKLKLKRFTDNIRKLHSIKIAKMQIKRFLRDMIFMITLTFITAVIVTLLWNLLIDKIGPVVDWRTAIILSIIIGVVVPIARKKDK